MQSDNASRVVKPRHFLTGRDDATIYNVSVLSSPAEWHAAAMGVLAAIFPPVAVLIASYIAGRQFGKQAQPDELAGLATQVKDAVREPVYWIGAWLLARAVLMVVYGVSFVPPELMSGVAG